jgi:hypothetical protein
MSSISKAVGAGVGGAIAGAGTGAYLLPEGTPWYGYIIMAAVTALIPAVVAYFAPKNAS